MKHLEYLSNSLPVLSRDFDIEARKEDLPRDQQQAYETIKQRLADRIAYLIDLNFEELVNIFYRIDLNEQTFHRILRESPTSEVPDKLAEAVIKRQIEKVWWRRKFSGDL